MGSPEKPIDLEMGDMSDETKQLNPPDVDIESGKKEKQDLETKEQERFTGLKKEELLEVSSQRKWVVARWILFILFWVGWVGMLVAAIVIVINAPRCKPQPTLPWHQDTVVYEADVEKFSAGNGIEGVELHLDYIVGLNARTLALTGIAKPDEFSDSMYDDGAIKKLVESAHEKKMPIKIVAALRVDVLSTTSAKFVASSSCTSGSGTFCDFFVWADNSTVTSDSSTWADSDRRSAKYKVDPKDPTLAVINYNSQDAKNYIKTAINSWIARDVDGFHLYDMGNVANSAEIVAIVREAMNASKDNELGLFLSSFNNADLSALLSDDDYAPLVVNSGIVDIPLVSGVGKKVRSAIEDWRNSFGNENRTTGFALNPTSETLQQQTGSSRAAGAVELLNIVLPGIPMLKSGDETGLDNSAFIWESKKQVVQNASESLTKAVASTIQMRVENYAVIPSLRWDRADQFAKLTFIDTDNDDVVAFTRQWDTKPTILVISNLSPNNQTITHTDKDGKAVKGKVISSSAGDYTADEEVEVKNMKINSYLTVIVKL